MKLSFLNFVAVAWTQLKRNKGRSFLTMLGVIIGVMSVVLLVSIGNGLRFFIEDQFKTLGANKLYIIPGNPFKSGSGSFGGQMMLSSTRFDFDDIRLVEKVEGVTGVAPSSQLNETVTFANKGVFVEVHGTTTVMADAFDIKMEKGRFFTPAEESRGASVAVIGYKVYEELFSPQDPIGKKIDVAGKKLRIIGLAEKRGTSGGIGSNPDAFVFIPYKVMFEITGTKNFYSLMVVTEDEKSVTEVKTRLEKALLKKFEKDDFSVADQTQILSIVTAILSTFTLALSGIASISLIVGGVGIMNIMFVSVTERIREIGLRKAVGATKSNILSQFLLESVILSVAGGTLGVLISYGITLIISRFFPAVVTLWCVVLAFGVSAAIGIIFGVAPARKAASMSPIDALRYE